MRFYRKEKQGLGIGHQIIVNKFLWLPLTIVNETRWLEIVKIKKRVSYELMSENGCYYYLWENVRFENIKKRKEEKIKEALAYITK